MPKILFDQDAELTYLEELQIGVIGYGNQGRAHALNLRDSGLMVKVGARPGGSWDQARSDGFDVRDIENVVTNCDALTLTLPDEKMTRIYKESIEPHLRPGMLFVFAHGFTVHHKILRLPRNADVVLVAPTGPGHQLRTLFTEGRGLPALVAVHKDFSGHAFDRCLAYARAIGSTRAGVIETSFEEETVTDLFCEQAVLCGGIPELIKASFNTLVEKGYQPELAYISCLKEVKLIADLLFDRGLPGMRDAISTTARYGAAVSGPKLVDSRTSHKLSQILEQIEQGDFASDFLNPEHMEVLRAQASKEDNSRLAKTGEFLRRTIDF